MVDAEVDGAAGVDAFVAMEILVGAVVGRGIGGIVGAVVGVGGAGSVVFAQPLTSKTRTIASQIRDRIDVIMFRSRRG